MPTWNSIITGVIGDNEGGVTVVEPPSPPEVFVWGVLWSFLGVGCPGRNGEVPGEAAETPILTGAVG